MKVKDILEVLDCLSFEWVNILDVNAEDGENIIDRLSWNKCNVYRLKNAEYLNYRVEGLCAFSNDISALELTIECNPNIQE